MAELDEQYMGQVFGISNPYLVSALEAAAQRQDETTRRALYAALLKSTLILLTGEEFSNTLIPQHQTVGAGEALKLVTIENVTGDSFFVAFTDEDAVLAWIPDGSPYLALQATALFTLAANNDIAGVIINPAGPVIGRVLQHEFLPLAQGRLPFEDEGATSPATTMPDNAPLLISHPATSPPALWLDALHNVARQQETLTTVYLFQLQHGDMTAPVVVGVCLVAMDDAQQQREMDVFIAACEQALPAAPHRTFIVLSDPAFLQTVQDTVAPLYTRPQ